jgi:hypothetical protein
MNEIYRATQANNEIKRTPAESSKFNPNERNLNSENQDISLIVTALPIRVAERTTA